MLTTFNAARPRRTCSFSAVRFGFRGLSQFQVVHCDVLAVKVAGFPEDHGGVLVGGDRLVKPPHLRQREADSRSRS